MSYLAEKRYLDRRTDRIKLNALWQDADPLPKRHRTFQSFKASFGCVNHYEFEIADCSIVVDVKYAFRHFNQNTYNEKRSHINGTLLSTLHDPILIIRDTYKNQPVITFYKTFKTKDNLFHIVMFKAYKQENGKYYFKTIFDIDDNLGKVRKIIKTLDMKTIYFKYTEGNGNQARILD